ncbi:MAG: isoprenoid biosynthesis glyoxalase ElbB [Bacteroidales bacterium]
MKKIAVVLAGNGVFDGSEIHETTLTLYSIVKNGASYEIFAPNIDQHHVINHLTGDEMKEKRNVLTESARIARGEINDLGKFKAEDFDAIIFPGGFGVAKNLCTFAFDGPNCKVNLDVEKAIRSMHERKKPIGALCISPVLITKVLGDIRVTIGQDKDTAKAINEMGAKHQETTHGEVILDKENKIVTTPCYMLDANIGQIGDGANNIVKKILEII